MQYLIPYLSPSCSSLARPLARRTCRLRVDARPPPRRRSASPRVEAPPRPPTVDPPVSRARTARVYPRPRCRARHRARAPRTRAVSTRRSSVGLARRPTPSRDACARGAAPRTRGGANARPKVDAERLSTQSAVDDDDAHRARRCTDGMGAGANLWERVVGERGDDDERRMRFVDNTNESARVTTNSKDWRRRG